MTRKWLAAWLAAVVMTLVGSAALAAEEQPTDTQFDVARFFSGLSLGSEGGSVSTAFRPVPEIVSSAQGSFNTWLSTLHTDDPSQQALIEELRFLCAQDPPTDFTFTSVVCTTPDAVDDIFDQPDPPVVVVAEREQGWNLGQSFQLTIIGIDIARDVYDGPADDPNTGNNTSFDLYWAGSALALGLTTYSSAGFDFVPYESGIAVVDNPGFIAYLLPGGHLSELQEAEVWINDGGWDQAPLPIEPGSLFFGPSEFVTSSIAGSSANDEEPEGDPAPEEPDQQVDDGSETDQDAAPEDETENETQEDVSSEEEPDSSDGGVPVAALVAGGVAVAAVVTGGAVLASRRRRGKCEELLADYDEAFEAWAAADRAMQLARSAYVLGDTAGTEDARQAQETAEQAEREAWNAERRAWNNYLDCTGEARAAARTAPVRSQTAETSSEVAGTAGAAAVVTGTVVEAAPEETATAPPPPKPEPCVENEVKDLEELETLRGSLTLAYTVAKGTEGIRSTEAEAADMVRDLNEVGDQVSEINDAIQDAGSGAGAIIADAAATVLELTARLGAGAAAAAGYMLEGHRVYNLTYEEHRVVVDMRWVKFLRCVGGSWKCFYDLQVKDFHRITIPQTEEFHGDRTAREDRLNVFIKKGENAVARDRPKFELFMDAHEVGPC